MAMDANLQTKQIKTANLAKKFRWTVVIWLLIGVLSIILTVRTFRLLPRK